MVKDTSKTMTRGLASSHEAVRLQKNRKVNEQHDLENLGLRRRPRGLWC